VPHAKELAKAEAEFFSALSEDGGIPEGLRGRFEIYRYAYFERIRGSIEEDYPTLFEYLESVVDQTDGLDTEKLTRDLLARNHPSSWTLAEAGLSIRASLDSLLSGSELGPIRKEALRLADADEAESLASWLEEWPETKVDRKKWVSEFTEGRLRLARTKTWRETEDRIYWRNEGGVRSEAKIDFSAFAGLLGLVSDPIPFSTLGEQGGAVASPEVLSDFLRCGIGEGRLRFVAP
jgi:hypothetical protein